jgi:nucleoid-associated protein YgaU
VQKGDTLSEIAARLLGSVRFVDDILKANPRLRNPNDLKVGQVLILPTVVSGDSTEGIGRRREEGGPADQRTVTEVPRPADRTQKVEVRKGDTLYGFAERYLGDGNQWRRLLALNRGRIGSDAKLVPGTTILVPTMRGMR